MPSVFGQSLYGTGGRIAGFRVRPLSAHHMMALLEIGSPYVTDGEHDVSMGDTTAALAILGGVRRDGLAPAMCWHGSAVRRALWRLWWLTHDHARIAGEVSAYIAASVRSPVVWRESTEGAGARTGAPWPYYLVSMVAQEMPSIPYADLWDMPLIELACHKAIIGERMGDGHIAERDMQRLAELRARKEAAA